MDIQVVAEETKETENQMSDMLTTANSEINQTAMNLSSIKQNLSQLKQVVRRNDLHNVAMGAMTDTADTLANTQASGRQKSKSGEDAVCGFQNADLSCATEHAINDSMLDNVEQEDDQFSEGKTVVIERKCGVTKLAIHLTLRSSQ